MEMDNGDDFIRNSGERLTYDVLVCIFSTFHVLDLVLRFSRVSRPWKLACSDPSLWETLDLTALGNYFSIPQTPLAWSDANSSNRLHRILTNVFELSNGNITKLYFHFYASITDDHLRLAAESCPRLKRLVLSPSCRLKVQGFRAALQMWQSSLQSLMVPFIHGGPHLRVVKLIGETCLALKELKFACRLNMEMATWLSTCLPNLRVLSLRGSIMDRDALEYILDNMVNLEALNITHAMVKFDPVTTDNILIYPNLTDAIMGKASRLSQFYTCDKFDCETCVRRYPDVASMRDEVDGYWYNDAGEDFWRTDEISSLAY